MWRVTVIRARRPLLWRKRKKISADQMNERASGWVMARHRNTRNHISREIFYDDSAMFFSFPSIVFWADDSSTALHNQKILLSSNVDNLLVYKIIKNVCDAYRSQLCFVGLNPGQRAAVYGVEARLVFTLHSLVIPACSVEHWNGFSSGRVQTAETREICVRKLMKMVSCFAFLSFIETRSQRRATRDLLKVFEWRSQRREANQEILNHKINGQQIM
jgi:hypothetical protein